jgi:hypothetical protein
LRDEGKTIAAGKILKYKPQKEQPNLYVFVQKGAPEEESKVSKAVK